MCYFKRFDKYDAWCTTFKGLDLLAEQTWSAVKESAFAGCNQCIVVPTTRSNCNKIKNIQCNARTSIQMQLVQPVHLLASFEREPIFLHFQPLSCDMRLAWMNVFWPLHSSSDPQGTLTSLIVKLSKCARIRIDLHSTQFFEIFTQPSTIVKPVTQDHLNAIAILCNISD